MATGLPTTFISAQPHDNYCLIPHPREPRILMFLTQVGWTLPQHAEMEAPDISQAMHNLLPGLHVTFLRVAYDRYKDEEREEQHIVSVMENHAPSWMPPAGGAWISSEELRALPLAVPEHGAVLDSWFAERAGGQVPAERVPWARPGWYAEALAWITKQLQAHGYRICGPVEQVRMRVWSCVLRVPATTGALYFKAVPAFFAHEPVLTVGLARLWPALLPSVLTIDATRHWMLMEDAGTTLRHSEQGKDVAAWEHLLDLFSHMQIDSATHQEHLLTLGCPDRRLEHLPMLYASLLHEGRSALLLEQKGGLNAEEYHRLCTMLPEIHALCAKLAGFGIPEALHHDDFHDGNILCKDGRYLFFDWAECAVAHPFYSMIIVLRYTKHVLKFDEVARIRLRDAYLAPWTCYAPMEDLLRAFDLAQRLGLLCRALTWYKTVSHLVEAEQWAYADTVAWNLRNFLYYPRDLLAEEA
ncbi:MAG TPA: phosphotransferase [Ktedonobacteraceae bacterium]|nr:phosphotransferase [Ktedonobacteraceae bacterium]